MHPGQPPWGFKVPPSESLPSVAWALASRSCGPLRACPRTGSIGSQWNHPPSLVVVPDSGPFLPYPARSLIHLFPRGSGPSRSVTPLGSGSQFPSEPPP